MKGPRQNKFLAAEELHDYSHFRREGESVWMELERNKISDADVCRSALRVQ